MDKDLDLFVESLDRTEGYMSLREKGFWDVIDHIISDSSRNSSGSITTNSSQLKSNSSQEEKNSKPVVGGVAAFQKFLKANSKVFMPIFINSGFIKKASLQEANIIPSKDKNTITGTEYKKQIRAEKREKEKAEKAKINAKINAEKAEKKTASDQKKVESKEYTNLVNAIPTTSDEQVAKYLSAIMQDSAGQSLFTKNVNILQALESERPGILEKANIDAKKTEDGKTSENQYSLLANSLAKIGFFKQ